MCLFQGVCIYVKFPAPPRMKSLVNPSQKNGPPMIEGSPDSKAMSKPVIFQPGALQELMIEVNHRLVRVTHEPKLLYNVKMYFKWVVKS